MKTLEWKKKCSVCRETQNQGDFSIILRTKNPGLRPQPGFLGIPSYIRRYMILLYRYLHPWNI